MSRRIGTGNGSVYFEKARQKWVARIVDTEGNDIAKRFTTEKEAKDWIAKTKAQITLGEFKAPSRTTLEQWVAEYLMTYKSKTVRPKTMLRYFQTAKHLDALSRVPLEELTTHKLQQFFNQHDDMSRSSLGKIWKLLNAALDKALVNDLIDKNPMRGVELPKTAPPKTITAFSDEETESLLSALEAPKHEKIAPMVKLALYCGLRLGEVLGLRSKDIDRENNTITIANSLQAVGGKLVNMPPKTQSSCRTIYAPPELLAELPETDGYVFATANGTAISPSNFHRCWHKLLEDAGLPPDKHFHSLRHTHATKLIAAGVPVSNVSHRLGHANISTTLNVYTHPEEQAEKMLQKVVVNMVVIKPQKATFVEGCGPKRQQKKSGS